MPLQYFDFLHPFGIQYVEFFQTLHRKRFYLQIEKKILVQPKLLIYTVWTTQFDIKGEIPQGVPHKKGKPPTISLLLA